VTSSGGELNDVFTSTDEGATWVAQGLGSLEWFFTGISSMETGPHDLMIVGFHGETGLLRMWVRTRESGEWTASDPGGPTVSEGGQPLILDCSPMDPSCLIHWKKDVDGGVWRLDSTGSLTRIEFQEGALACCEGDAFIDAAWAPSGDLVLALENGVIVSSDGGVVWETGLQGIGPTGLSRAGGALHLCANPYLLESFLVGRSLDGGRTWSASIDVVADIQPTMNCGSDEMMNPICEEIWESLVLTLGLGTGNTRVASDDGVDGSEEDTGSDSPGSSSSGSGCQSGATAPLFSGVWGLLLGFLCLGRSRHPASVVLLAFFLGAGCATPADEPPEEPVIPRTPHSGMIVIGEFVQAGSGQQGIVLNAEFAAVDSLVPPFDSQVGADAQCSVRLVEAGDDLSEPTGVSVGNIFLEGNGLERDVLFQPFDFGEDQGGVAYDHDADSLCLEGDVPGALCTSDEECPGGTCDLLTGIFADTGVVEVGIAGEEGQFPAMTFSVPAPPAFPVVTPGLGWVLESSGDWEFEWEPSEGDQVLVELDTFPGEDGSRVQIRCVYEDLGSGVVPAEALIHLANQPYSVSVARATSAEEIAGMATVNVVLTRREVSFVFSP